jgi:hypothetical protein
MHLGRDSAEMGTLVHMVALDTQVLSSLCLLSGLQEKFLRCGPGKVQKKSYRASVTRQGTDKQRARFLGGRKWLGQV